MANSSFFLLILTGIFFAREIHGTETHITWTTPVVDVGKQEESPSEIAYIEDAVVGDTFVFTSNYNVYTWDTYTVELNLNPTDGLPKDYRDCDLRGTTCLNGDGDDCNNNDSPYTLTITKAMADSTIYLACYDPAWAFCSNGQKMRIKVAAGTDPTTDSSTGIIWTTPNSFGLVKDNTPAGQYIDFDEDTHSYDPYGTRIVDDKTYPYEIAHEYAVVGDAFFFWPFDQSSHNIYQMAPNAPEHMLDYYNTCNFLDDDNPALCLNGDGDDCDKNDSPYTLTITADMADTTIYLACMTADHCTKGQRMKIEVAASTTDPESTKDPESCDFDVYQDGEVDVLDVIFLIEHILA